MFPVGHRSLGLVQRLVTSTRNFSVLGRPAYLRTLTPALSTYSSTIQRRDSRWADSSRLPQGSFNVSANTAQTLVRPFHTSLLMLKDKDDHKPTLVQRFKRMYKDYWYVLVPVHCFTSVFWFGGFYFMCKSGVDVVAILEWLGTSHEYLEKIQNSDYAYYALAYACYKVATPARYTVTLGGTTVSIKYLSDWGYLKSSSEIAEGMKDRAEGMRHKVEERTEGMRHKAEDCVGDIRHKAEDMKEKIEEGIEKGKDKLEHTKDRLQKKKK